MAFCLFCALPPLVIISLGAHLLVDVALFKRYLGQNHAWRPFETTNRALERTNYKLENTGVGHYFRVPMPSVSPYLNLFSQRNRDV